MAWLRNIGTTLEMIKWEHSIFALPFALCGAMLAAGGWPAWNKILWIVVCMITARSAGMAFNRWADAQLDAANPRTAARAIPAGILSRRFVAGFTVIMSLAFILSAAQLNRETLLLSPVVLVVLLLYSYTKRFTRWSHLVLGLALGMAPAAAWIAIRGTLDPRIVVLTAAVLFWVGGFDVLYACQDMEHDRQTGLNSIPAKWGISAAFWIARLMHVIMLALLLWLVKLFALGSIAWAGVAAVAILLLYEHLIVSPTDMRRLNAAFFTLNGIHLHGLFPLRCRLAPRPPSPVIYEEKRKGHPIGCPLCVRWEGILSCLGPLMRLMGVDALVHTVVNFFHFGRDPGAGVIGFLLCFMAMVIRGDLSRILGVTPSLFCRTFHLICYALVGQALVAHGFANPLLHSARYLLHFPGYLVLVHDVSPCLRWRRHLFN